MTPKQMLRKAKRVTIYFGLLNCPIGMDFDVSKAQIRKLLDEGNQIDEEELWSWNLDGDKLLIHFVT